MWGFGEIASSQGFVAAGSSDRGRVSIREREQDRRCWWWWRSRWLIVVCHAAAGVWLCQSGFSTLCGGGAGGGGFKAFVCHRNC